MANDNLSSPSSSPARNLLDLPGEIRNMIYEYALTDPEGIKYVEKKGNSRSALKVAKKESNQLKYVNRQLHNETKGLGLRYNDFFFTGWSLSNQLRKCANFLSDLPEHEKPRLRILELRSTGAPYLNPDMDDVLQTMSDEKSCIALHCALFANIQVKVRIPHLYKGDMSFLFDCIYLQYELRGHIELARRMCGGDQNVLADIIDEVQDLYPDVEDEPYESDIPPNFRFFPVEEGLSTIELRRLVIDYVSIGHLYARVPNGEELWVSLIREIYEKGI